MKIEMAQWRREVIAAMNTVATSREVVEKATAELKKAEEALEKLGGQSIEMQDVLGSSGATLHTCDGKPPNEDGTDGGKCTEVVRRQSYEEDLPSSAQVLCWECRSKVTGREKAKAKSAATHAPVAS